MADEFFIRKIALPDGSEAEVLHYMDNTPDVVPQLSMCREDDCHSHLVYPISWKEQGERDWHIRFRCPECTSEWEGTYDHADIEVYDEELNRGTDELIDGLERLARHNFETDIELLVSALEVDALLPMDF